MNTTLSDDRCDDVADEVIQKCIKSDAPKSFFLYAGAGSGKTRSLVTAIRYAVKELGKRLSLAGQQIAVITYTNAACDEIKQRLEYDPLVDVRTIHSFAWSLIDGFNNDIRNWVGINLLADIAKLEEAQAKGRAGTKTAMERQRSIDSKRRRYENLSAIRRFIYSPNGDNRTRDSLNHSEVIAITSNFLTSKTALQHLLVSRYPMLLIDESQDTNKYLMDALLYAQSEYGSMFSVGLFGDTMQRIYADGKVDLAGAIPANWEKPKKRMNHRCPQRVIKLINRIRFDDDGQEQLGRSDKSQGHVRLFVLPEGTTNKHVAEERVAARMVEVTGDGNWAAGDAHVKTLTLEHHMAATRFGFQKLFEALYAIDSFRTGLLDGSLAGLSFFTKEVLPVISAMRQGNRFVVATLVRQRSPLLSHERLKLAGEGQVDLICSAKEATESLFALFQSDRSPNLIEILINIAQSKLFEIPDVLIPFIPSNDGENLEEQVVQQEEEEPADSDLELVAWRNALESPFEQIEKYSLYVQGKSKFDTHQGVKGCEFPRVMVVINDNEARGFMFSYDKLFGLQEKTKADHENEAAGRETSIARTRRLLYVTCSRAEESLAIVYYASDPRIVKRDVVQRGWFEESEVELMS